MDNLTHSLIGLTLAQTPLRRAGRGARLTLLVASNAPDSDIVLAVARGGTAYLSAHRGSSHGPLGIIALAVVAAGVVRGGYWYWGRRRIPDGPIDPPAKLLGLIGVALIGTLLHCLMDLPTSYGTRSLSPFDRTWYSVDWMPIIDGYLWALLLAGQAFALLKPAARSRIAAIVLVLVTANYLLRAELHAAALRRASGGRAGQALLSAWPDLPSPKLPEDYACAENPCSLTTAALPTFGSPFRWRIVRQSSSGYQLSDLNLLTGIDEPVDHLATEDGASVDAARATLEARALLSFSRFPVAEIFASSTGPVVQIRDVRFLDAPLGRRAEQFRPRGLFIVTIHLDHQGKILHSRLGN